MAMKQQPTEITVAKLECVVMPNGEVICLGRTLGWWKDLRKYLTAVNDPRSRENVAVKGIQELASYMTPAQLRRAADKQYGLGAEEALEMAYDNMVQTAKLTWVFLRPRVKKKKVVDDGLPNRRDTAHD